MEQFLGQTAGAIGSNCRIKLYPGGTAEIMVSDKPVFRDGGWEPKVKPLRIKRLDSGDSGDIDLERSKRRAIAKIYDYALCSGFEWFVTLTLNKEMIDRHDYGAIIKKLNVYCSNAVQRKGLRYILVPEEHEDGALHFHGFFAGLPKAEYVPSGTYLGGCIKKKPRRPQSAEQMEEWIRSGAKEVYNLSSWKLGFTTAVRLSENYDKAVTYITKYIRKADNKVGGRWYLSGGNLKMPEVKLLDISMSYVLAMDDVYTFNVPGSCFAMWRGDLASLMLRLPLASPI